MRVDETTSLAGACYATVTPAGLADGLALARLRAVTLAQTAATQVGVQFGAVADLGHRRGPVALQVPHAAFHARLLLRPAHQAEARLEAIVTGQGLVTVVELALAADTDVGRHGFGIVPPQLARHAAKKGERFDQAMQDGFGALARQGQGEGAVGIAPGDQQHRHELAAAGEVNVDVAEVGFEALAGFVGQRNEGLGRARLLGPDIEAPPV